MLPAKDVVRTVETLGRRSTVKHAKLRCSQPDLLLDLILTERIIGNAKRALRYIPVNYFNDLYVALKQNLTVGTSVELCRAKLENCRQNNDSVLIYNQRFWQALNELNYAIQAEHSGNTARKIALQIEEKSAIKKYIMNLRDELGIQVRPLKPGNINEAQEEALEAETWLREKNRSRPNPAPRVQSRPIPPVMYSREPNSRPVPQNPPNQNMPLNERIQLQCSNCKKK